ncbi:MAG: flavin reductase [Oscillospiraceae bacterium]
MDSQVLSQLSYGIYAIGVNDGGRPVGCIVNTVMQVTAQDPIISVSMSKNNYTCGAMRRTMSFSVSIVSEQTRPIAISQLGFFSARDCEKYEGLAYHLIEDGIPLLEEACTGFLICDILSMLDTESHVIFTARVRDTQGGIVGRPMSYAYYHEVVKGKAPKNAPTYRKEDFTSAVVQGKERWICEICGYVHEGPLDGEPEDYICPICGVDQSHFKKQ